MLTIGLAGGIASGKSLVASQFERLGAKALDADKMGHDVLRDEAVIQKVKCALGSQVLDSSGQLSRKAIAELVFEQSAGAKQRLANLEKITHPRIKEKIIRCIEQYRSEGYPAAILDAPVMFKSGWDRLCEKIVFVRASEEVRLKRALERGWSEQHFQEREASQTPLATKLSRATDVINNNKDVVDTNLQVKQLWEKWDLPLPNNCEEGEA